MADKKYFSATGNAMVADALRQINPDVVPAYPITPQTTIMEAYAKFVADGVVTTEFVPVESEHSAMSAAIGASAAGARVATATSSQGLAYMYEALHIASGMRCPIVMPNANRAISAPINIHGDHSDVMGARDSGWLIMFAENAQEAYDNTIIAFKVAEDPEVLLPVMPTLDGFVTTHAMDVCTMEEDQVVKDFVGEYKPLYPLLDTENPVGQGMFATLGNGYMKYKLTERWANSAALDAFAKHGAEWAEITGRPFDVVETWGTEDADFIIVVLGSCAGNARYVARQLREQGVKAGIVKPRVYRPFPGKEIAAACAGAKAVAVIDRSDAFGAAHAPLSADVHCAFYDAGLNIPINDYVLGLGGADITLDQIKTIYSELEARAEGADNGDLKYLGFEVE